LTRDEKFANLYARTLNAFGYFIPPSLLHFSLAFSQEQKGKKGLIAASYVWGLVLLCLSPTSLIIKGASVKLGQLYYPDAGRLYFLLVGLFFFCLIYSEYILIRNLRRCKDPIRRNQYRYIITATLIGFLSGATYMPMVIGKDFPPIGGHFIFLCLCLIAYAIARHELLDITLVIKKTVAQVVAENEKLKQEVRRTEKLKAVAQLAAGMAHEIKNPLTAIKTFTEHLEEKHQDPEFRQKFARIIGTEVGRIDKLIHNLLDFAKPAPLQLQSIAIEQVLDETLGLLANSLSKKNIQVVKKYDNLDVSLQADPNQLKQAFLNLILNSLDAMQPNGTLTIATYLENGKRLISIKDTGCGIPKKDLPSIFDPFYSSKESGTGLGLSVVYGIIHEHGGSISVDSKVGSGTEVVIEIASLRSSRPRDPASAGQ